MRIFFNFDKNAGVLAALLCCMFFNPAAGKAQSVTVLTTPKGNTIKITYSDGAVCGNQPQAKFTDIVPGYGVSKNEMVNAIGTIPKSNYFKINKRALGNPTLRIETTNPASMAIGHVNMYSSFGSVNTPSTVGGFPNAAFNIQQTNNGHIHTGSVQNEFGYGFTHDIELYSPISNYPANLYFVTPDGVAWLVLSVGINSPNNNISEGVKVLLPFSVLGAMNDEVPVLGTTVQPQIPYLVLHAPPGDGSSSEFQKDSTFCREFTNTYAEDGSNSINAAVKLGIAGSVGFIVTTDFEFSVTVSAGLTAGGLSVKTNSNQTCVTTSQGFSTNSMSAYNGGDVFIGYGTDLNYGIYRHISIDQNTCLVKLDTSLIYSPTGTPRDFVYTAEQIQNDIAIQKALADNPAYSVRARNEAQNQVDVWEKVLAANDANINNPNNTLIQSLSFSAGANTSRESSISVLETNSLDVEHYIEFNAGVSAVVEVAGSGVSGGYEYKGAYRYGETNSNSGETSKVVRYNLADDDGGDLFNMRIVRDPMFGTPIFRLEPGTISSCPYQGGYQRDQPKLKHDGTTNDHITSQGNPVGSSATFKLDLCNESNEARIYHLKLNAASNLNGAVVSAAGVPLNGNDQGQVFPVPANGCIQDLIVEVKQLSTSSPLAYPDLELFLFAPCEEDIQTSVFASVFFGNATGVNDLADNNLLSVSPNPTSGWLQISLPAGNTLEAVRVMDLSGKTVRNLELGAAASNTEIDLSGLPKGIYALQARAEGQVFVKKVIVE